MEIVIDRFGVFDSGYVVASSIMLTAGTTYYLEINTGTVTIRTYTPTKTGNVLIDTWGTISPSGYICLALYDELPACPSLGVVFLIS